ncbi:GTPase-activating protein, putative [Plasmodium knowlesi strain H]|uniref:GTPase-activating protein, putative n=3 Tax=Plasmodium knowlesi TaxID=5850 RepID=A0A5E7X228_PLAKH|nr:GTPase-activating protein, putative [Plasmodium knowlesi strain H]OTN67004.1 putative GTPase-activating protein [Plasmodium knowlesi]CAA9988773.1 GTPase-activating protein, putative [Plasmodium knowlesi strain H]SBO21722.1 GTPase-activating protein, putative [Plasmodium knowlesi strain H]SBO22115.1 GTPase-activating protein, putative [Plasmodium knowlesi strain H]VVS78247.1 GTPase-activating protein, putative [Plasmodium knowlesi strain H]
MNHNEGRCNFVVHEGKETVCGQWGVDERRGMVAKGNLPCRNENRNGLQQSYEGGELFNLKRGVQRDSPRKTTQEGCAIFPKEQHADGGRNQKNGWTGQSKSGGTGQNKSGGIGQNKSRCTKKRSNIEEEKELPSGEHTPDEGKKENYVTYCEDGYLRELLKNALVNPSMKAFLGTRVISFLNEKERHNCSMVCKLLFFETYSMRNLRNIYKRKFIRSEKRSMIWKIILLGDNIHLSEDLFGELTRRRSTYEPIIEKDVPRTFPHRFYSSGGATENITSNHACTGVVTTGHMPTQEVPPGNVPTDGVPPQEELFDVLKICSLYFQNVGYCQGMNYVAAILFLVLKDKLYTARCFIALLKKFNLKGMYILKFPQLKKIMYQLKVLIKGYFPKLFSYFRRKKIKIDFFCINWFMTLFAQDLTFDQTVKLWDSFLLFGLKILIKVSLVFLCHFEKDILSLSYEEALTFLKSITRFPFTDHLFEEENFFAYLGRFKVTNRTLKQIIFLRKNGIKFEVHVREVCHRGVQTNRCSVVLCENGGWREKMVQEIGGTCSTIHNGDNLMHRFMGIFRGVVDNRTGVSFGKTVGERKRRPPSRRANQAICTNFFLDPSRSNEVTPENQCLSLNFNSGLFCGVKERSRYLRGDSTICEGTTREEEATAEDECSARPTGNASIETNTYYDLNLTKSFR